MPGAPTIDRTPPGPSRSRAQISPSWRARPDQRRGRRGQVAWRRRSAPQRRICRRRQFADPVAQR
ncbi:MAG: hypothetical protein ACJ8CR_21690, partial [Roseiflexaceae bacterium]